MTTRRMSSSSIVNGGGNAAVRYQPVETPGIVVGELWIDNDETVAVINANDYLMVSTAANTYLSQNSASTTYATQTSVNTNLNNVADELRGTIFLLSVL